MTVTETKIPDLLILEPQLHTDPRGYFMESFNATEFRRLTGVATDFVQDNHAGSSKNVLRGLHYQLCRPQGKLVRVVSGEVFDVAVDLRAASPTCGQWVGVLLSHDNHRQLWIPPGFAHGYLVLSEQAEVLYKTTEYYAPECERCVRWDDAELAINWPVTEPPILSTKDQQGGSFAEAELFS